MNARSSAAGPLVLLGSVVVLVAGLFVGFRLLTASAETIDAGPTCETRVVAADDEVTSNLITVDVYNASSRAGLANRVSINLQRRGFLAGQIGNSTSKVDADVAVVLTTDRDDPRVRLVAAQFGSKVQYAEPDIEVDGDSVTVIVGDDFKKLGKDVRTTKNDRRFTVCLPTVPAV
ncbi:MULTISPECIES: LytR C-terminal domain-containing protein [unclassified Aeromicrobium]|uniref:LytR C-terminal domain-containing protein n=1 Tax=unclassified Aeromicrobium TaxID=2633570 RepID=UPI00288BBFB7|nr:MULTISPECIES: LytR C-terminal domain-containing protein [unclassified Aeromicrobium]